MAARVAIVPPRTPRILIAAGVVAIVAGGVAIGIATSASDWLMARLARNDLLIDAAAVGGATAALGGAALATGIGLIGLAIALRLARTWARPATAAVAFALVAALLGSLAAIVASWVRDPGNAPAYVGAAVAVGIGLVGLTVVLLDVLRAARPAN
jgi:hypothetical protein